MTEVCKQCNFYVSSKDATDNHSRTGECRVRAPININNEQFGIWPVVTSEGWCGEFNGERS